MLEKLFKLKWLGLGIVVVGLVLGLSVKSYITSQNSREVEVNVVQPARGRMCEDGGWFATTSGFRYCFIFKAPRTSYANMKTECKTYGELAVLADGETQQDILDIINEFQPLRSKLAEGYEGGGGPTIFDTCQELVDKFGNDKAIFAENGGGGIDCGTTGGKPHKLIFDKELGKGQNGRLNDTNGFFDILGGLCQMEEIPNFQIESFNDVNGNKKKDDGEGSTDIEWAYQYRIDGGEWKNIKTTAESGLTKKILALKVGSVVEVKETVKSSWKVTTVNPVTKTLDTKFKSYVIQFGNQQKTGASPSPSPSPATKPSFQIRKFNDLDGDGTKDTGEGSTEVEWTFRYKVGDGDWKTVTTAATSGLSAKIVVAKGSKVTVQETTQAGWKLTTPNNQVKTLSVVQNYIYGFGNKKTVAVSPSPSPSPATKPSFQIRKFNDLDGDGTKDAGEGSTNKQWTFKYKVGDGDWKTVTTAATSGLSAKIVVAKGSKVTVQETTKAGWKLTTPNNQVKTLSVVQTYIYNFGNVKTVVPSASVTPVIKPKFHIRNFNDLDGDGEKDANEGSTNLVWSYQYRVNGGDWKAIETDATTGLSVNKPLAKGSVVEVEELLKDDWTITTPSKQSQTLSVDNKVYVFDFGNKKGGIGGPSPTPGADDASFIIHKFLDANKNGVRESGEGSTGRTWVFAYQINGGDKREYKVEADKTIGDIITVKKNDVIKVGELGQEGWLNTTGAEVTQTLSEPITYTVYFGNWPVDGVVPPTFPPKQPNTGTPTWLTLGALGLVAGLLLVKKYGFR